MQFNSARWSASAEEFQVKQRQAVANSLYDTLYKDKKISLLKISKVVPQFIVFLDVVYTEY